jgi:hypothetical protein
MQLTYEYILFGASSFIVQSGCSCFQAWAVTSPRNEISTSDDEVLERGRNEVHTESQSNFPDKLA